MYLKFIKTNLVNKNLVYLKIEILIKGKELVKEVITLPSENTKKPLETKQLLFVSHHILLTSLKIQKTGVLMDISHKAQAIFFKNMN